jgi:hypothetical protein
MAKKSKGAGVWIGTVWDVNHYRCRYDRQLVMSAKTMAKNDVCRPLGKKDYPCKIEGLDLNSWGMSFSAIVFACFVN